MLSSRDQIEFLASTPLFQSCPRGVIEEIGARFIPRSVGAHSFVMMQDHQSPSVAVIWNGSAKVSLSREGRETLIGIVGVGELLGEIHLLDGQGHSADIYTLEETKLLWIPGQELSDFALANPCLLLNVGRILSRRLRLSTNRIEALSTLDVSGRVAHLLLAFAREYGQQTPEGTLIPLCLIQSDLAALCGATRTRVNQALVAFKKLEYLDIDRRHYITIREMDKLAKRVG